MNVASIEENPGVRSIIISTLAEYQTEFWIPVAKELEAAGSAVTFVSCDSRSTQMLKASDLDVVEATLSARDAALGDTDPIAVCTDHGIDNPAPLLTHERFAFALRDTGLLLRKLAGALLIGDAVIARARSKGVPILLQELGGFLSVVGLHHAALNAGVESLFIEPSFFKGRMLLVPNTLGAFRLGRGAKAPATLALDAYLDRALESGTLVVPAKDKRHYSSALAKLISGHNIRRLVEKARDKYLFGAEQEFGAIGHHVWTHLRMLWASWRLRGEFTKLSGLGPFLYYPLHVPGDVALTLRSGEYLDQLALLDYLCRNAPAGLVVATKEHPAMIGAVPSEGLLALKARYDNFAILPPATNNYAVLRQAKRIVTVNSKSGAEAGLLGKSVLVLGDAFYRDAPFAHALDRLADLGPALNDQARTNADLPDEKAVRAYFAALWQRTYPGELYVAKEENVAQFCRSLAVAFADHAAPTTQEEEPRAIHLSA